MIAVDSPGHSHRRDSGWFERPSGRLTEVAEGSRAWAVPWPCVHEFFAIVTPSAHLRPAVDLGPRVRPGSIQRWLESANVVVLMEGEEHWETLSALIAEGRVSGLLVHDARIAAICLTDGARELRTADRHFSRFLRLGTRFPSLAED